MTFETTEDIRVENLTVTKDASATRLNVPEEAAITTLYVGGTKCGHPAGFTEFYPAQGQLWAEFLYADSINGRDLNLKGDTTLEGDLTVESDLVVDGDLEVTGKCTVGTPLLPYIPTPLGQSVFNQVGERAQIYLLRDALLTLFTNLTEAGLMAPAPEPTEGDSEGDSEEEESEEDSE